MRYNRQMESLTDEELRELSVRACAIRQTIVEMLSAAGSGHTAGPLGMADIFAALYFRVLKHDPKIRRGRRDRLMLKRPHRSSAMRRWRMQGIFLLKSV